MRILSVLSVFTIACGAAVFGTAGGAQAAVYTVSFTDVCGGVTVTTDAPDGTPVKLRRGSGDIGGFLLDGGTFTAGTDVQPLGVTLGDQPEVSHIPPFPAGSCLSGQVSVHTFEEHCFGRFGIGFQNHRPGPGLGPEAHGFSVLIDGRPAGAPFTVGIHGHHFSAGGVEDGDIITVRRELPDGIDSFFFNHVYDAPAGCGPQSLNAQFGDVCDGFVHIEVTNEADGRQSWFIYKNGQPSFEIDTGAKTAIAFYENRLAAGDVVTLLLQRSPANPVEFARHTYREPTQCTNPGQAELTFTDSCDGTNVLIMSYGRQGDYRVESPDETTPVRIIDGPGSTDFDISGSPVTVWRGQGNMGFTAIGTHTYVRPAGCPALPVTGGRPPAIAFVGIVLLLAGLTLIVTARTTRPRRIWMSRPKR